MCLALPALVTELLPDGNAKVELGGVAKTVSLVVTPAQANRITLAENMGEMADALFERFVRFDIFHVANVMA